jgi:hypothetical protein
MTLIAFTRLGLSPGLTAAVGIVLYFGLSLLVGWWNQTRANKFSYGFLFSLVFTPIGGFLVVALTDRGDKKKKKTAKKK